MQSHLQRCWDSSNWATGDNGSVAGVESLNLMLGFYFSLAFCMRCLWMVWLTRTGADRCCHAPWQKAFCSEKADLKPTEQYGLNQLMNHRKAGFSPVPAKCSHPEDCWSTPKNLTRHWTADKLKVRFSFYLIWFWKVHRAFRLEMESQRKLVTLTLNIVTDMTSGTSSFISDKGRSKSLKLLLGSAWPQRLLDDFYLIVLPLQCGCTR